MAPFPALLISGETYKARHALRRAGGRYDHARGGYILPATEQAEAAARSLPGLDIDRIELDRDPAAPETADETRERRNAARARRADRLESQATNRDRDAANARARHRPYTSDYAFITQPILVGHHSQRRHERLWDKIDRARDEEVRNSIEAEKLRDRAAYLRNVGAQVKGDAAARRQRERDANDAVIRVGSIVVWAITGRAYRVTRINRHTYSVRDDKGSAFTVEKSHVSFVRHEEAAPPARAFRKGQRVKFQRLLWKGEGTVIRVNPTGCTVEIPGFRGEGTRLEKFQDDELSPIEP